MAEVSTQRAQGSTPFIFTDEYFKKKNQQEAKTDVPDPGGEGKGQFTAEGFPVYDGIHGDLGEYEGVGIRRFDVGDEMGDYKMETDLLRVRINKIPDHSKSSFEQLEYELGLCFGPVTKLEPVEEKNLEGRSCIAHFVRFQDADKCLKTHRLDMEFKFYSSKDASGVCLGCLKGLKNQEPPKITKTRIEFKPIPASQWNGWGNGPVEGIASLGHELFVD